MSNKLLSVNDTLVLKGMAIIAIMIHNFVHRIPGSILENQHLFNPENHHRLMECIQSGGPHILLNLFSYYGHYGVSVFVFLSGYGLVMKYENTSEKVPLWAFMRKHIKKLWLLLLPLLLPHFLFLSVREPGYFQEHWLDLICMVGFIENLRPDSYVFHGPWWFFSLIAQLYLVYHLCVYRHTLKTVALLTAVCVAGQFFAMRNNGSIEWLQYIRFNFMGAMLPFIIGIVMARKGMRPTKSLAFVALLFFIICGFNRYAWLMTFGLVTIAALLLVRLARFNISVYNWSKWTGSLSANLFAIHPIVRECTFWLHEHLLYISILAYLTISVLCAFIYRIAINRYGQYLQSKR